MRLCDYIPDRNIFIIYERDSHSLNSLLLPKFSIFQSLYRVPPEMYQGKIEKNIFPPLDEIKRKDNLFGMIIKYNISERLFFSPKQTNQKIIKLYDYNEYKDNNYSINDIHHLLLRNGKLYQHVN